jgi:hypothetical protein
MTRAIPFRLSSLFRRQPVTGAVLRRAVAHLYGASHARLARLNVKAPLKLQLPPINFPRP